MTAKLYELLAFLIQEASDPMPAQSRTGVEHVQRACDFIASHYQEPITINDIAGHVGICRSRLYRVFKAHLSISPLQYLTEFRLREACNLMNRQKATVKEVAYAAGFSDPLYFSTVFKKSLGQSPKEYMKSSKGGRHLRDKTVKEPPTAGGSSGLIPSHSASSSNTASYTSLPPAPRSSGKC